MLFLSNDWMVWFWREYSVAIIAFPTIISFLFKLVAIYHPKVQSNKVVELIEQYWPKKKKNLD